MELPARQSVKKRDSENLKGRDIMTRKTTLPRYIVMTASAKMPSSCKGHYRRVGVVELAPGTTEYPKMMIDRAKGIARIVETWERLNVGKTERSAYAVACREAEALAARLNA